MLKKNFVFCFVFLISLIAALGGFLLGFNASVISGALLFLEKDFSFTAMQQGMVVSILLIGAGIGSVCGGFLADLAGRKKVLLCTALLFFVGSFFLSDAQGFGTLLWTRFLIGCAAGIGSVAVPLYISEISPFQYRGFLVSMNQLLITIGGLSAFFVALHYAEQTDWRNMFFFGVYPAFLQGIFILWIPETPSWLMSRGQYVQAEKASRRLGLPVLSEERTSDQAASAKPLFKPELLRGICRALIAGIGLSLFQQITGVNIITYYAPKLFQIAGYDTAKEAIFAAMMVGFVNVIMTFASLWLIDWVGRRFLLVSGLLGMTVSLVALGFSFFDKQPIPWLSLGGLMAYIACFAISLGPCVWLIISEIYPKEIRGRLMGVAILANWLGNFVVSITFCALLERFGASHVFWLYAIICLFGLWFIYKMIPETKGKTLEEIQNFWSK